MQWAFATSTLLVLMVKPKRFLAGWLETKSPEETADIVVGSKWGYTYTADWQIDTKEHEVKEHSVENLEKQWQESRDILGNHLNLYQIHSATLETGVLENRPILTKLAELKAEGICIGLSLSGEKQAQTLEKALDVRVDGEKLFDTVQATYNVLEPSVGKNLSPRPQRRLRHHRQRNLSQRSPDRAQRRARICRKAQCVYSVMPSV